MRDALDAVPGSGSGGGDNVDGDSNPNRPRLRGGSDGELNAMPSISGFGVGQRLFSAFDHIRGGAKAFADKTGGAVSVHTTLCSNLRLN